MYEAWQRRDIVDKLEQRKLAMLNGIWSCQGMIDGKDITAEVERIEDSFRDMIDDIYGRPRQEEIDLKENPFFAASQVYQKPIDKDDVKAAAAATMFVLEG